MELSRLIIDIDLLYKNANEDYQSKRFESYQTYLDTFNRLLREAASHGVTDLPSIDEVPENDRGSGWIGSDDEIAKLREIVNSTELLLSRLKVALPSRKSEDDIQFLQNIFNKFGKVARQLRDRYGKPPRPTLEIEDEYDVQDLLHSLLKLRFDDIRKEEWTPSYAGSSSRMDFLLKNEQIVIEVKKTRKGLEQKELGNQLIIDIAKYSTHSDCKTLICFVYDPELRIGNPTGIENDLNTNSSDRLKVLTFIRPTGE